MLPAIAFQAALFTNHIARPVLRNHLARRSLLAYSNAALSSPTHPSSVVSVFDNVLSPACRTELTSDALYNTGPDVYRRDQGSQSPQEVLIESILVALGSKFDTSTKEVEWWGRCTYKSVEAHRDVDEEAASTRGVRRYPTHSLIVYLDVEEGVRGPTCLWIPIDHERSKQKSALVAVPVVPGRLLVFSGELLHAVPCPPLQWLDPLTGNAISHGHVDQGTMRRVLVLNLWDDYAPKDEEWMDDDEEEYADEWDDDEEVDDETQEPIEFFAKLVECEHRSSWKPVSLEGPPLDDDKTATTTPAMLSTRSHGSDKQLLSPTSSHTAISEILDSKSKPQWIFTGADVTDLGIGVPSIAGLREERRW